MTALSKGKIGRRRANIVTGLCSRRISSFSIFSETHGGNRDEECHAFSRFAAFPFGSYCCDRPSSSACASLKRVYFRECRGPAGQRGSGSDCDGDQQGDESGAHNDERQRRIVPSELSAAGHVPGRDSKTGVPEARLSKRRSGGGWRA